MSPKLEEQIENLKKIITEMEDQRQVLGDAAVDASLVPFQEKLAELQAQVETQKDIPPEEPVRQRKLVTLLYMDIVGSTAMTQHLDPEDTLEIMDNALPRLAAPIEAHGGHVSRYTGDGFKAVFGDPVAREDDPEQAIRAGLGILKDAKALAQELRKDWGIEDFKVRIGIDTGLAALGGQTEAEDTVMGRVVNLAVRIESAAPPGGLLISHNTYRHVRGVFTVEAQEPITAKGFPEPVPVYLVKQIKPRAFRVLTRGVEGVETRMVGRVTELDFLKDALLTAIEEGEGQVTTITGEAGVGKSRLLYEFQNWLDVLPPEQDVRFFQGRGRQEAQGLAYSLLRDVFAFRFQILDDDTGEQARQKIETGFCDVYGQDEAGIMRAHILGQLLGFDFSSSSHLKGVLNDAEQLRNRGVMYMIQYFQDLSQEIPVVIFLEDIHWADDSSLDIVNQLGERTSELPFLIVCAARLRLFERRPYWGEGQDYHTLLDLRPLSKRENRNLVTEILKLAVDIPVELRELVVKGAEGNPFYTEELIKMLIEDNVIIPDEKIWRIDLSRLEQVDVPSTLAGVLQARLDSLPAHERTILQQASVVGRLFWDSIVAFIQSEGGNGDDRHRVPLVLTSLRDRELIYRHEESAFAGAIEYFFKHDVLREVTYESVIKKLRETYHGLVADWLIANGGDLIGEYSGLIAEHLVMARREENACQYYLQAGEFALSAYANQEAETQFSQALSLKCKDIDKSKLLEGYGEALSRQNRYEEAIQKWSESIELNLSLENMTEISRLYAKSSRAAWWLGDTPRGLDICLEGLKLIKNEPDSHEVALLLHETARAYNFNGMPTKAYEYCTRALHMAEQLGDIEVQADTLATLGLLPGLQPDEVIENLTQAVDLADKGNFFKIGVRANLNLGELRFEITGDIHEAHQDLERALVIALRRGNLHEEFLVSSNLLGVVFHSRRLSELIKCVHSLEDLSKGITKTDFTNRVLQLNKAVLLGLKGELLQSLSLLVEIRANAQKSGDLQHLVNIDNRLIDKNLEIHWSGGEPNWKEVEDAITELIDLGEKGWSKTSPLCLLSIANSLQGKYQDANQSLEEAKLVKDDYSQFWNHVNISRATANLAASEGRWEDAIETFEDLTKTFADKGYRWNHARYLCDWADSLISRGEPNHIENARDLYKQAFDIYAYLEATWYQEQVEKRLNKITK
ncbi:MAG: AAA family ATPase [Chloroflexota bacterium]|nr:MAG: AAA family ATPase [Chloroflexota bacterium]